MISCILPVYNGEKFLTDTIRSILNQTEENFELIIVNDGSTDNSEECILAFNDKRIKYIKQENMGKSSAKNTGLTFSKGDFITFHDSDDISLPNRFEKLLSAFYSDKIGMVHSDMLLINEFDEPIGYWQAENITQDRVFSFFINVGTPFNNGTVLYRKRAVLECKFDPSLAIGEDTDFILYCHKNWEAIHIPEPLYLYRRHGYNSTNTWDYEIHAKHIRKHLTENSIEDIVTEVKWLPQDGKGLFKAKLIVGLALSRRWMMKDGIEMFVEAIPLIKDADDLQLYEGMKALFEQNFQRAESIFGLIENRDHIIDNYHGEALLGLKKYSEAYKYFLNALTAQPKYYSPIQNIKSMGILRGHNLIDKQWEKFK